MEPHAYYDSINENLIAAMDPIAGKHVLEIGCASGRLGERMKADGAARYVGVERVPQVAALAQTRLDEVVVGDVEQMALPFAPESFDYIVFGDVLEHLTDPWTVLRRSVAYLKPGGAIVASIPNVNHVTILCGLLQGRWEYADAGLLDRTHLRFFTLHEIIDLFAQAGLAFDQATACRNMTPQLEGIAADLDALRRKYGLGSDRFSLETRTYQWLITARRPAT
jgi:2-polyprenyl-3-methyl-5-hydroxy-6-metoxy-1,4-benzoquinol methylase